MRIVKKLNLIYSDYFNDSRERCNVGSKVHFSRKKQKHRLYQGRVSAVKVNVRNNVHAHTHEGER
jgi:hypothetical protein